MESSTTSGEASGLVPNHLAQLVPSFDPSKDELTSYTQKVQLLMNMWPESKWTELSTRLILNCHGSAFKKLQLHQQEVMKNERKSIQRLIEILGGHWGQINLEKQYEFAERALYRCQQKSDESADSYLARADILWTELTAHTTKIGDLQAFEVHSCPQRTRSEFCWMPMRQVPENCLWRRFMLPSRCLELDSFMMSPVFAKLVGKPMTKPRC